MGSLPKRARVLVVHNPAAGLAQPEAAALLDALRALGFRVTYRSLAEVTAREALACDADLVVAAGGDGTVAKVARRLLGSGRPLTLLPLGTANNLARHLAIDLDPFRAIDALGALHPRALDAGVAAGPFGRRVFFEGAGLGLLASSMSALAARAHASDFTTASEKISVMRRSLLDTLRGARPAPCRVRVDGEPIDAELLALEISNVGAAGPRIAFASSADSADGAFDVVLVEESHRGWLEGALGGGSTPPPRVVPAREVRLDWAGAPLHVDDVVYAGAPRGDERAAGGALPSEVKVAVAPRALTVLAPRPGERGAAWPVRSSSPTPPRSPPRRGRRAP